MNILLELSKQLKSIDFEMTPEQNMQLAGTQLRNVSPYFRWGYMVRMRVNGAQQTIGITPHLHVAARFSDMARLYFSRIGARQSQVNSFNFDRATAEADLSHPTAAPLLGEIVNCLFPNGVPAKPEKPKRKSLRLDLEALKAEVAQLRQQLDKPTTV